MLEYSKILAQLKDRRRVPRCTALNMSTLWLVAQMINSFIFNCDIVRGFIGNYSTIFNQFNMDKSRIKAKQCELRNTKLQFTATLQGKVNQFLRVSILFRSPILIQSTIYWTLKRFQAVGIFNVDIEMDLPY